MMRVSACAVLVVIVVGAAFGAGPAAADVMLNHNLQEWERIGQVTIPTQPQQVRLEAEADKPAWIISQPLEGVTAGQPFQLSFSLRCVKGDASAAVSLLPAAEGCPPQTYIAWQQQPSTAFKRWRRVHLTLVPPITAKGVRLALGARGGDGAWEFANLDTRPRSPVSIPKGPLAELPPPRFPQALPDGWQPEGNLDGKPTSIGKLTALNTMVGSLEISMPAEVEVMRGERHRVMVLVTSHSTGEKTLEVSVQGPVGVAVPDFSVPVAPRSTMRFYPVLQCMRVGDAWYKFTFGCDGEYKSVPVRVHCYRGYPFFGCMWRGGAGAEAPTPEELAALDRLGISTHYVVGPPDSLMAQTLKQTPGDLLVALSGPRQQQEDIAQLLDDLGQTRDRIALIGAFLPPNWALFRTNPRILAAGNLDTLAQVASSKLPGAFVMSVPFYVDKMSSGLGAGLSAAVGAGIGEKAVSLVIAATGLPTAAAIEEAYGKATARQVSTFWVEFDKSYDPAPLRTALTEAGVRLPLLLIPLVRGIDGGRLDALMLGRMVIDYLYQGATGVAVPASPRQLPTANGNQGPLGPPITLLDENGRARPEICAVYRELARELAAAVPLASAHQGEGFGVSGGAYLTYKPFLRGNDGIVAMWNNSGRWVDVAVETRCLPLQMQVLRISYDGQLMHRQFMEMFQWSEEARKNHQTAVYVRVAPLQIVVLTLKLSSGHNGWLRRIDIKPQTKKRRHEGPGAEPFEKSPWWRREGTGLPIGT